MQKVDWIPCPEYLLIRNIWGMDSNPLFVYYVESHSTTTLCQSPDS